MGIYINFHALGESNLGLISRMSNKHLLAIELKRLHRLRDERADAQRALSHVRELAVIEELPPSAIRVNELLHEMTSRRIRGESYKHIAVALNNIGLRGRYGGRWYERTVRQFMATHSDALHKPSPVDIGLFSPLPFIRGSRNKAAGKSYNKGKDRHSHG